MADTVKISALDEIASGALDDTAVIPVVDGGTTQKLPISKLKSFIGLEFATDAELTSQVSTLNTTIDGLTTSDISEGTNKYYTDAKVKTKLNTEGVISSSAQFNLGGFTTSELTEGSNLYYTDTRVKTKLNTDGVYSGSTDFDTAVSASAAAAGFGTDGGGGGGGITAVYNGLGLLGGGESGDVTLTLDTGSLHFTTGVSASAAAAGFGAGAESASINAQQIADLGAGIISSSDQIQALGFTTEVIGLPNGVISGSQQLITLGFALTSSLAAGSVPAGTISSSAQVNLSETNVLGFDTSYVQENPAALYYTNARVESHLNTIGLLTASAGGGGGGGVSSSAEIVALLEGQQLNFGTASISASYLHIDTITAYANGNSGLNFSDDSYSFGSDQEVSLKSDGNIHFVIDANNNQGTGSFFGIYTNNNSIDNARNIFRVYDNGEIRFNDNYSFPEVDGLASQVLSTDGSGNLYFATTGSSFSDASIPQGTVSGAQQIEDLGFATSLDVAADISSLSGSVATRIDDIESAGVGGGSGIFVLTSSLEVGEKYTTANNLEITGSVSVAGPFIVDGAFGDDLTNKHEFTGSLDVTGSVTATDFIVGGPAGAGVPTLISNTNLNLSASNAVVVNSSPLRLAAYLDSETGSLSPQNGDMIYNSTTGKVSVYQSSNWTTIGAAGETPQGTVSGALQIIELGFLEADNFYVHDIISSSTQITNLGFFDSTDDFNLKTNTSYSLFLGYEAAFSHSILDQSDSVVIGGSAGTEWEFGTRNTLLGFYTNRFAETSADVTAIGYGAARDNISGSETTAIGSLALAQNQIGLRNTAVGFMAQQLVKTNDNTSLGYQAGRASEFGAQNTSIGSQANYLNESGSNNTSIGYDTLSSNISGSSNIAVGTQALQSSVGADSNIGLGNYSLQYTTLGEDNVSIGERAGILNTTGNGNIFVGNDAGFYNVSGSYNVIIGHNTQLDNQDGVSNQILIGSNATGSGANTATIGNTDITDTYIAGNVLPIANESYDLGSPTQRWKDLYLSGSTIDLGGTLITRNTNGNIEFLDSGSLMQKSIEIAAITGSVYVSEKITAGEAVKLQPQHPLPSGETGMLVVSGSELWFYGVGWGKVTVS